jgi:hypothetical protein
MVKRQLKDLCCNFDDKYFPRNKCREQNIFMAISNDVFDEEVEASPLEDLPPIYDPTLLVDPPEFDPLILLHALNGFSVPQTFKLIGYIKHNKVIIVVNNGSTHNFIHCCISQEINCYIHVVKKFQIMISNGGSMKCGGCFEMSTYKLVSTT